MTLVPQLRSRPKPRQVVSNLSEDPDRWVMPLSLVAAVLAAGWLLIGLYLYFRAAGPIMPGMRVGDTEVGGLTVEQAAVVIDNGWNRDRVLHVSDGNQVEGNPLEFGCGLPQCNRKRLTYCRGEHRNPRFRHVDGQNLRNSTEVVFTQSSCKTAGPMGPCRESPTGPFDLRKRPLGGQTRR